MFFLNGKIINQHSWLALRYSGAPDWISEAARKEGCVRERKMYKQLIKHDIKALPISVENLCENDARTSDAEIIESCANMESKR